MPPPATAAAAARVKRREDDADADVRAPDAPVLMEGPLRKQGARVHMWSPRYAVLRGSKLLMYRGTREEVAAVLRHPAAGAGRGGSAASLGSRASGAADHHQPPPPPLHKREFVLMPGCYVSEVRELPGAAGKGRSLWEFRLHWPEHVHHYGHGHGKGSLKPSSTATSSGGSSSSRNKPGEETGAAELVVDSDDEDDDATVDDAVAAADGKAVAATGATGPGAQPPLQRVAGQTARTARAQQKRAQEIEQAEQAHQSLVSKGAALAGVVVGGVVIGALTAGVGLVPYLGLVGTAAVVSGGAVAYTAAQAPSSRVLLAAETESEALRWKGALELQVAVLEGRRPPPPPEIDLLDVDQLIRSTAWRSAGAIEGLRVLEEERGSKQRARAAALCRKMQTVLSAAPIKVFLAFMATEGPYPAATPVPTPAGAGTDEAGPPPAAGALPPQLGPPTRRMAQSLRTVQQIDDHTDVVHVLLQPLPSPPPGATTGASFLPSANSYLGPLLLHPVQHRLVAPRDLCLLRYWRLDDDGVYTVCLTSVKHDRCPEQPGVVRGALNGVLSIAPRKDYADFDDDLPEALVTYIVEVDPKGALGAGARADRVYRPLAGLSLRMSGYWRAEYADLVLSQILDVKEHLEHARFRHRDAAGHGRASSLGSASGVGGSGALGGSTGSGAGATTSLGRLSLRARLYASSSRQRRKREKAEAAAASAGASAGASAAVGGRVGGWSPPRRGGGGIAAAAGGAAVVSVEEAARTQQVNAAALRARIAAKEYEVRRLEAELGRGGGNPMVMNVGAGVMLMASGSSTAAGTSSSSSSSQGPLAMPAQPPQHRRDLSMDLLRQLQAHVDEAARLKAEYRVLTGKDYGGLSSPSTVPSITTTTAPSSAADAPIRDAAPAFPTQQRRRAPLSPRRLLQRHHSHQQPPASGHSPPRRIGTYGGDEGAGGDGMMVGSPLASSAPAGPMNEEEEEEEEAAAVFLAPSSSSSRTRPSSRGGAVIDPFKWESGVPDHWFTRETGDGGRVTWEAVVARLLVVLVFCAMLFLTLSMRRLLALGVGGGGGISGAEAATEL